MDNRKEETSKKLEAMMAAQCGVLNTKEAGKLGYGSAGEALRGLDSTGPCQDGLTDRIGQQINHALRERRKLDRLEELRHLLDKNPEVARILELIEQVNP